MMAIQLMNKIQSISPIEQLINTSQAVFSKPVIFWGSFFLAFNNFAFSVQMSSSANYHILFCDAVNSQFISFDQLTVLKHYLDVESLCILQNSASIACT